MAWFIDLGANCANTLRLYETVRTSSRPRWNVVAFEASPLFQPFVRDYCAFLNGERNDEPENCLPRSGSTSHLLKYAHKYGCPSHPITMMRECMWKCLSIHLNRLAPDPALNSSDYIDRALRNAFVPPTEKDRYTLVPAAAGDRNEWTTIYEDPKQLIRGGALHYKVTQMHAKRVRSVDVAAWLLQLPPDAHVFLKIDIEGAEHDLVRRMDLLESHRRIAHLSIECHGGGKRCIETMRRIRSWNVTIVGEKKHHGMDAPSRTHITQPVSPDCQCKK